MTFLCTVFPLTPVPGSLSVFKFLLYLKYSHKLLLGEKNKRNKRCSSLHVCFQKLSHVCWEVTGRDQSLSYNTHVSRSIALRGMVREKQASLW